MSNRRLYKDPYTKVQIPFKVCLIGNSGVGKTFFAHHHSKKLKPQSYEKTIELGIHSAKFYTSDLEYTGGRTGIIRKRYAVELRDCPVDERYAEYYEGADAAIILFDVTSLSGLEDARLWEKRFRKVCPGAPIVLVGNKVDLIKNKLLPPGETMENPYYYHSNRSDSWNCHKPFLDLLRQLTGQKEMSLCLPPLASGIWGLQMPVFLRENWESKVYEQEKW